MWMVAMFNRWSAHWQTSKRKHVFFFFLILMPLTYVLYITGLMHLDFLKVKIDQENCFHYLDNVSVCSEVFETFGEYIQQWLHYYS